MRASYLAIFAAFSLVIACDQQDSTDSTLLFDSFHSRSSPVEVEELLGQMGLDWTKSIVSTGSGKDAPTINGAEITVDDFSDAGIGGSLTIGFLDDQLSGVIFTSINWEAYQSFLQHKYGRKIAVGDDLTLGTVEISAAKDYQNRIFIRWADSVLFAKAKERSISQ